VNTCRGLALGFAASMALTALAPAADDSLCEVAIALANPAYFRGGTDPVKDLKVTVTLKNRSDTIYLALPEPMMDPLGALDFEVHLLGAPTGVARTEATPERTRILRCPTIVPVGELSETPAVTIRPQESKVFTVDAGHWYDIKAAGKYELVCLFQDARSNAVEFEVLPVKRVDVPAHLLLGKLSEYERGNPDFPFMFYITRGPGRFDTIVYLTREGEGGYEHYEAHWLGQISTKQLPQVQTQGAKIGLVVPDKANAAVSWTYVIDFGRKPEQVKGEKVSHEPGSAPQVSFD
jgi:hypothetical protein